MEVRTHVSGGVAHLFDLIPGPREEEGATDAGDVLERVEDGEGSRITSEQFPKACHRADRQAERHEDADAVATCRVISRRVAIDAPMRCW